MSDMKKPKLPKVKDPIAKGKPGGKYTPGERKKAGMSIQEWAAKINREHDKGPRSK